jgi:saccharopine dehydrogenase-like NADP-dependent oxidoreductase
MRILIVGAGAVGSAAARIAVRRGFFEKLVLADYDPKRPQAIVDELGDDCLAAAQVDASSAESVASLIREHGATHVLNAVDPRFVMPIFDGCFAAGATYLDMAMSLSYPHPE